ncbi:2-(1,2-epoxy-1,2-dihydrophenyl)acetyl-CoA isomerase [Salipaludibacillus keqinensis]|uniref:2-(1,2-epoxy-1,2-dihydrophenyl)acetyl-CoA isomerase n=1 Tax=Salipaludibacillus keqinensis TaxID=2045207 RepID=A0A323TJW1_9BACI|nr:enoyl-CoA hydratase-related protein [Salipaludibacillus keqinensis]PYZ94860.1 2-(1,2-epoxy-1,2-dihydrophenyl)acetyl-CoA isomerase [Salipaludibacillus keqinensis]
MKNNYETIRYTLNHGVVTITLNRPEAFNAFTEQMNKEVVRALREATKDEAARSIILTGEGRAFCAGQDLSGVDENTNHATFLRERYHPMVKAMKQTPKPIIAAVNGTAAGAGMSVALAADFRLAKPHVKFVSAFMNIGLIPDSGFLYSLPRIVGYGKAMEMAVLGKPITGEQALSLGLVTEVFEEAVWEEEVQRFAESLASLPTKSFSLIKRYMMDGMHQPFDQMLEHEAQAQRIAGSSQDHLEGMQAFKEKRKPDFTGK